MTYHWSTLAKPLFPCQSNKYYILWVCVCSLMYPACNAHATSSYGHLWPVRLYNIFPHYLINGTIFWKNVIWYKMWVFWFLYICLTFLILRRIQRDIITNAHMPSKKTFPSFWSDFNKTLIFYIYVRKIIKYQISLKSAPREPRWSMRVDGWKGRQTWRS